MQSQRTSENTVNSHKPTEEEKIRQLWNEDQIYDLDDAVKPVFSDAEVRINTKLTYLITKRVFDIIVSLISIIVFSPIMLITAIAIKIEDPHGKVFYKAMRGGKNGVPFACFKFRSMYANADEIKSQLMEQNEMSGPVFKITNDPRVTKVGKFIRKTSIDELPQLFNVFIGDMSLVGPRPLPVEEEAAIPEQYDLRRKVTPGITCIWQVSGRNNIDFDEWMRLDLEYIKKQSLLFDLELLVRTIPAVITNRGAS